MFAKKPRQYLSVPLVLLLAVTPLLCCCFEGSAWAGPQETVKQSSKGCAHCDKKNQKPSQSHNTQDCDCPPLLAENGSLNVIKAGFPSDISDGFLSWNPATDANKIWGWQTASARIDKNYSTLRQHNPPPTFIIYHNLRI